MGSRYVRLSVCVCMYVCEWGRICIGIGNTCNLSLFVATAARPHFLIYLPLIVKMKLPIKLMVTCHNFTFLFYILSFQFNWHR